ncbi:TetR/AcrR family transcriptional regulator [Stenotrophomonas sp. NPDC077464]|uniref:TetR/AcrR family transcriptional regulator n=1 Tax=Stenotrophomonas nematodicola TaxID=2656746 RepID=A0ABW7CTP2_9GAMM
MTQPSTKASQNKATGALARSPRRSFDREAGVTIAKNLFHERGYDAVGIAELTRELDINPPSLYAAYGSKAGLFERCLAAYVAEASLPADKILTSARTLPDAVSELFSQAAALYTKSSTKRGCMAAEGMRSADPQARALAIAYGGAASSLIESYISQTQPRRARELADYVLTTLQGLSAAARAGLTTPRVASVANLYGQAFGALLHTP